MLAFYIKKLDGQLAPGDEQAFAKAFRDRRMLGYHFWSVEDIRRHQEYFGEVTGLLLAAVNIMPRLDLPGPAEPDGLLAELIKAIFEALQLGTLEELRRRFEDKELVFG